MIDDINFLVRMIALGSALMLLAVISANTIRIQIKVPLIGVIAGVIAYLLNSSPLIELSSWIDPWIDLISLSTTFFIWLFARQLFERPPGRRILTIATVIMVIAWFSGNFLPSTRPIGFFVVHIVSLALIIDLVRVGILEREDDLIERRRAIRLWLPLLVAAQAALILSYEIAEVVTDLEHRSGEARLFNLLMIIVLLFFAGIALLRTDDELLVSVQKRANDIQPEPENELSPAELVLQEKLNAAIEEGAYRTPGLTIARLADQLDTPEHRLRALINQRLGYRNFSAFLNRHRVSEAKSRLASREDVDLPVLTIAMDLGYNSLPTFNRAFRKETGTTPSDFRRGAIA